MKRVGILFLVLMLLSLCACAPKTPDVVLFDPLSPSESTCQTAPTFPATEQTETTAATVPTTQATEPSSVATEPATEPTQAPTQPQETAPPPTQAPILNTEPVSNTVWIPKSGKKYHSKATCSGMSCPEEVTEEEAESRGFTPCKKCYK